MTFNLVKGENINLSKEIPNLKSVIVEICWNLDDEHQKGKFDLDVGAFLLKNDGKVRNDLDFIFYNCLKENENDCVIHQWKDIKKIVDREVFKVDFAKIPEEIFKIPFTLTIYKGEKRDQNFKHLTKALIRIINAENGKEIANYVIQEKVDAIVSMIFAELYCHNGDWKFKAIGQGFTKGMSTLEEHFGVGC